MILLIDIGNTHTHVGLGNNSSIVRTKDFKTEDLIGHRLEGPLRKLIGKRKLSGACWCSVVPAANAVIQQLWKHAFAIPALQLTPQTVKGIGINYPKPTTIGQDRIANAVAAKFHFGAPSVVVDFGTAVTFDVLNSEGNYIGGIIAPGLSAMTDYLHEKTALLPRIRIREPRSIVGRSTEQAMLSGAVHGYRGLVRQLIEKLSVELKANSLPVVATGGYARLIAKSLPEITAVRSSLTLEGLRLTWMAHHPDGG